MSDTDDGNAAPEEGIEDPARTRLCPHWHKPCAEVRERCYFWINTRRTEVTILGSLREVEEAMCLYHTILQAATTPKVVMAPPGGPAPGPR